MDEVVHVARVDLSPEVPLSVHLVRGSRFAVLVDTGVADMAPLITGLVLETLTRPEDLRLILNTHAHHDHIGCNDTVARLTGALIGASGEFAYWHDDFDRHWEEFALEHPELLPDDEAARADLMGTIDAPRPVDLHIDEGFVVDLGGGVELETVAVPGHMGGELGYLERSTRTLILGDSLIGTEWSFYHGYFDVDVYVATLRRLRALVRDRDIAMVRAAHHPPLPGDEAVEVIDRTLLRIAQTGDAVVEFAREQGQFELGDMWRAVSTDAGKALDFRGLRLIEAHARQLLQQGVLSQPGHDAFRLRRR